MIELESAVFRANPRYSLKPWNRLGQLPGPVLQASEPRDGSFGLLISKAGIRVPVREASIDVALIFLALQDPGPIPPPLAFASSGRRCDEIARLLLDDVIELATQEGFIGGLEACVCLGLTCEDSAPVGRLAQISREALRYGARLQIDDPVILARRLYLYYRWPPRPGTAQIDGVRETLTFLGLGDRAARDHCEHGWDISSAGGEWLVFARRAPNRPAERSPCKLYVSPRSAALPTVFIRLTDALFAAGAEQFKVGVGTAGLLRPDKIVAYFGTRDDLVAAVAPVRRALAGVPTHGVPFSAELADAGLLSWGMDPRGASTAWGASWRQWITTVLASAMIGEASSCADERCTRALARLRLEGVDPATFSPAAEWRGWSLQ